MCPSVGLYATLVTRPAISPLRITRWHSFGAGPANAGREREADQDLLLRDASAMMRQAALADEKRLVHLDGPAHRGLERRGQAVGILSDDDVPLLQAQQALRFHTERTDA